MDHPHVHMIVPVGPLKGLFKARLVKLFKNGELKFPDGKLASPNVFYQSKETVYQKKWNVRIKEPIAGPKQVVHEVMDRNG